MLTFIHPHQWESIALLAWLAGLVICWLMSGWYGGDHYGELTSLLYLCAAIGWTILCGMAFIVGTALSRLLA